jgi:hypothetical protein
VSLGFIDRFLGAAFGLARGVIVVVIFVLIAGLTALPQQEWWQNATLAPPLVAAALSLREWLPPAWSERLNYGAPADRASERKIGFAMGWRAVAMCGIVGVVGHTPVNQLLYDALLLLQHRGQDAAGIVTGEGAMFHMHKGTGYVRDVFRTRNMRELIGQLGIGHCRYPTAGRPPPSSNRSRSTSTRHSASRSRTTAI